jgi:hypothetical protein
MHTIRQTPPTRSAKSHRDERGELKRRVALEHLLPLDRTVAITLGGEAAEEARRLQSRYGWMSFHPLAPESDSNFEAVNPQKDYGVSAVIVVDELGHFKSSDALLTSARELLSPGGVLLVEASVNGLEAHLNKAECAVLGDRHILRQTLQDAGFHRVDIYEVSGGGRARKGKASVSLVLARAWIEPVVSDVRLEQLIGWIYSRLSPESEHTSKDPIEILAQGRAWCAGYTAALGEALHREGYPTRWLTLIADDHPGGRGRHRRESHEVLEVVCNDQVLVVDPMVGVSFAHTISELVRDPALAVATHIPDERYLRRDYHLYATEFLYSRIRWVGSREDPQAPKRYRSAKRVRRKIQSPAPPSSLTSRANHLTLTRPQRLTRRLHNGLWMLRMGGFRYTLRVLLERRRAGA